MNKNAKAYIPWIDVNKGILILLVVLGHWVGALNHATGGTLKWSCEMAYKVIYSFHMPAFFVIAGMTWRRKSNLTFQSFVLRKIIRLLVPYFTFGIISALVYCCLISSFASNVSDVSSDAYYGDKIKTVSFLQFVYQLMSGNGIIANSVLWFLPCMFSVITLYFLIDRFIKCIKLQLVVFVGCILSYAMFIRYGIKDLPWGGALVPKYLACFLIGRIMLSQINIEDLVKTVGRKTMLLFLMVLSIGYIISVITISYQTLYPSSVWLCGVGVEIVYATIGTGLVMGLAYVISQSWIGAILERVGNSSLGIMLVHKFPILAIQSKMPSFSGIEWVMVPFSIVIFAIVSSVSYLTARIIQRFIPITLGSTR